MEQVIPVTIANSSEIEPHAYPNIYTCLLYHYYIIIKGVALVKSLLKAWGQELGHDFL